MANKQQEEGALYTEDGWTRRSASKLKDLLPLATKITRLKCKVGKGIFGGEGFFFLSLSLDFVFVTVFRTNLMKS